MATQQDRPDAWSGYGIPSEEELLRRESGALWPPTPPARPEPRSQLPTSIVAVLAATFDAYAASFGTILIVAGIYSTVLALLPSEGGLWGVLFGLLGPFATAVVIRRVGIKLRGTPESPRDSLGAALGRFLPLFGWDILMGLGIGALAVIGVLILTIPVGLGLGPVVARMPDASASGIATVGVAIGLAIGVPVGLVCLAVFTRWSLGPPAIVLDGMGPIEGSRESAGLARGRIIRIAFLLLVAILFISVGSIGAVLVPLAAPELGEVGVLILETAVLAALFPVLPILAAVLYTRLDGSAVAAPPPAAPRRAAAGAVLGMALILGLASTALGGTALIEEIEAVAGAAGEVRFGAEREECVLDGITATFDVGDQVEVVAMPSSPIAAGDTITIRFFLDGEQVDEATLQGQDGVSCLYATIPTDFFPVGRYRLEYARASEILAEGEFVLVAP